MRLLFLFIISNLTLLSFAQDLSISGTLTNDRGETVNSASVALSNPTDTSLIAFTISSKQGRFEFTDVDSGTYLIVVAAYGHEVTHYPIQIPLTGGDLQISLQASAISLESVMVQAKHIPILFQQDTVVYNANSFKVGENATVEDLMRKLPGLQVAQDGSLLFQGRTIGRVLVNGNEFFGDNVKAATRNLDAALVDKVEIIDRKTEEDAFTGEEGQEREQVINLVLKEDVAKGVFGRLTGAYGSKDYYDAKGNLNFFKNTTQLSIIGGANNVDEDLFDWGDVRTLASFRINPFDDWQSMSWYSRGIESPRGVGINLHTETASVLRSDLSYVFSDTRSLDLEETYSEVYLPGRTVNMDRRSEARDQLGNHRVNSRLFYQPDTIQLFIFRAQFNSRYQDKNSFFDQATALTDGQILNSGLRQEWESGRETSLDAKLGYTRNSKRTKGSFISTSFYVGLKNTSNQNDIFSLFEDSVRLEFPANPLSQLSQQLAVDQELYAATFKYRHMINEDVSITPGINWSDGTYTHDFQWIPTGGDPIQPLSPQGGIQLRQIEYDLGFNWKADSNTTVWFSPKTIQILEHRSFSTDQEHEYEYDRWYPTPSLFISSAKPMSYRMQLGFYGNMQKPGIQNLLPIVDSTLPNTTRIGNIRLQNYMNYNGYLNYSKTFALDHMLSVYAWSSMQVNPIQSERTLDELNNATTRMLNLRSILYTNSSISYRFPVSAIRGVMSVGAQQRFARRFSVINQAEVQADEQGWSASVGLNLNKAENWGLSMNYHWGQMKGSIDGVTNNAYIDQRLDMELRLQPIERWQISSELWWQFYGNNDLADAASIPLLYLETDYFFDQEKRWAFGLIIYDILDRSADINRFWSANSFVESRSNVITQSIMGRITYKIKKADTES